MSEIVAPPGPATRADVRFVLLAAGAIGFFVSARYESWVVAIESGQVLAGLVKYPHTNSFYIYNVRLPTVVNQVPAVLLRAGVPERPLNFVVCGLCGSFSFAAFALWTLALCRDRYLALLPPLLLVPYRDRFPFHLNYPAVLLPGSHAIYSMFGVAHGVLALALLGVGRDRAGLLLLGFAPAVHPTGGLWALGVGLLAVAADRGRIATRWPYLAAGLALAAGCLAVHSWLSADVPRVSPAVASRYIDAFIRRWDDHRVAATWGAFVPIALIASTGMALGALWLGRYRSDLAPEARLLPRAYLLAAGFGLLLGATTLRPDLQPEVLKRVIPGRYVNTALMTSLPLVVGLLGACRPNRAAFGVLCVLVGGLVLNERSAARNPDGNLLLLLVGSAAGCAAARWASTPSRDTPPTDANGLRWSSFFLVLIPLGSVSTGLLVLAVALQTLASLRGGARRAGRWPEAVRPGVATLAVLAALGASSALLLERTVGYYGNVDVRDWTNDPFYRALHGRSGMVMTSGDLWYIQLRSRKAVVLPRDINFLTYFPETGPDMDRVLRAFFGFGLDNPPPGVNHTGILPQYVGKEVWEARPAGQWRQLAVEFRFSSVVTPDDWRLHLPVVTRGNGLILYAVPGS